jgi:alkaline phosphatase D
MSLICQTHLPIAGTAAPDAEDSTSATAVQPPQGAGEATSGSRSGLDRRRWLAGSAAGLAGVLLAGCAPGLARSVGGQGEARFGLGIASGGPEPDRLVLWTRLTGAGLAPAVEVEWELAEDEAFSRIAARGRETSRADEAHSVHAEPTGLKPDRWYFYRFTALGQQSTAGRTRTAPSPGARVARLKFAIASCQRWDHGHYAAWRHMAAEQLDLVVFLGDYIYEYGRVEGRVRLHEGGVVKTLDQYRARYAQYKADPALQAMHAAAPWLATWDDHEVENDYAGLQGHQLQAHFDAQRAAAYQAWWEHMPVPRRMKPVGPDARIVGSYDWGDLARILVADCRQQRSPQACNPPGKGGSRTVRESECAELRDPTRSFLGAEQEAWLARSWSLDRRWNLLAQSTLMARFATREKGHSSGTPDMVWTDGWEGYPLARQRLLQTLADRKVPGAVVLGGDVHAGYIADLKPDWRDDKARAVATECCGTSISSQGWSHAKLAEQLPDHPHIRYGRGDGHGYMSFELAGEELHVQAREVDDVLRPDSGIHTDASFVVPQGRPGAIRA